jgi:hypothetical protein
MRLKLRTAIRVVTAGVALEVVSANTYRRVVGSFVDDGYVAGDEVAGLGFPLAANNSPRLVVGVTPTDLTVLPGVVGLTAAVSTVGPSLFVATPRALAMERRSFTAPVGLPYMKELLIPAGSTLVAGIGSPRRRIHNRGIYQITLVYPEDYGTLAQDAMADCLVDTYHPDQDLIQGGYKVTITSAESAQALGSEDGMSRVPVSIGYKVFTLTP